MITITIGITITLTMKMQSFNIEDKSVHKNEAKNTHKLPLMASKRVSRFLAEQKNPRAADHCNKDNEICQYLVQGKNSTCCNNKCMDLRNDDHNCGACKNKCEYTETCCRGECVDLAYDKRHCGYCNNRCKPGLFCLYGMCDYA